jgi:cysteinyl-tRNA synthetase
MIDLIEKLLEKGVAYKAQDGIYISIDKVKDYGALAHMKVDVSGNKSDSHTQQRISNDEYDKDNPHDFALWKFKTSDDGDASWEASFGEGRPGWHIECSAMAMKVLGSQIDIHTGGIDLIFPHHTNEIAQTESITGKKFVQYWIHGAFMTMGDGKMAKSKGNIVKVETLRESMISPIAFRYWVLTGHYRSPVNFTSEAVQGAQNALIKLMNTISAYPDGGSINAIYKDKFQSHVNNDMAMPQAIALVWEIIKDTNISDADKRATILDFDKVLGLNLTSLQRIEDDVIPEEIQALADAREEARKAKEWDKADALRIEIENRGFTVSDTSQGIKIVSN